MPTLVRAYPSVSPWNIRTLTLSDYARLIRALNEEANTAEE